MEDDIDNNLSIARDWDVINVDVWAATTLGAWAVGWVFGRLFVGIKGGQGRMDEVNTSLSIACCGCGGKPRVRIIDGMPLC